MTVLGSWPTEWLLNKSSMRQLVEGIKGINQQWYILRGGGMGGGKQTLNSQSIHTARFRTLCKLAFPLGSCVYFCAHALIPFKQYYNANSRINLRTTWLTKEIIHKLVRKFPNSIEMGCSLTDETSSEASHFQCEHGAPSPLFSRRV